MYKNTQSNKGAVPCVRQPPDSVFNIKTHCQTGSLENQASFILLLSGPLKLQNFSQRFSQKFLHRALLKSPFFYLQGPLSRPAANDPWQPRPAGQAVFHLPGQCHRDQPVAWKGECEVSDLPAFCLSLADKLTVSTPRLPRQCGLPSSEECQALAEAALCQGDLFAAVKFHLLSSEPEAALHMGIDHVKGTDGGPSVLAGGPPVHTASAHGWKV